jgi:cyclic pyranopterin phosphate synthase
MAELSHIDEAGRPVMVDVSGKIISIRKAGAAGFIRLAPATIALIKENKIKKGNVCTVAELAGIQAAKKTSELIPLCHMLPVSKIDVHCVVEEMGISATSEVFYTGRTGVEMEALTAVSVALLAVYDMCKAVDKTMVIEGINLLYKEKKNADEAAL